METQVYEVISDEDAEDISMLRPDLSTSELSSICEGRSVVLATGDRGEVAGALVFDVEDGTMIVPEVIVGARDDSTEVVQAMLDRAATVSQSETDAPASVTVSSRSTDLPVRVALAELGIRMCRFVIDGIAPGVDTMVFSYELDAPWGAATAH